MKHTEDTSPCWWWASLFIYVVLVAIMTACSEELPANPQEADLPATISLDIRIDRPKHTQTRAVDENSIADLHVLIYNNQGELIGQKYEKYENNNGNKLTVNTRSANRCAIYAIANTGNEVLFKGREAATEEGLKGMITPQLTAWNGLSNNYLVMTGSIADVTILPGNNTLSDYRLTISRIAAKVTIKLIAGNGISVTNYQICNLPTSSYYTHRPLDNEVAIGSRAVSTSTISENKDVANEWMSSVTLTPPDSPNGFSFYMYENRRGNDNSITTEKDKKPTEAILDNPTYITINGVGPGYAATWIVYLGSNNTSNFDIKRNSHYTYTIKLNGASISDTRVEVTDTSDELSAEGATANCYIITDRNTYYSFDATIMGNGHTTATVNGIPAITPTTLIPKKAFLVWETGLSAGQVVDANSVYLHENKKKVYFKSADNDLDGNALIAITDDQGKILWSWHIWKTAPMNDPRNNPMTYKIRNTDSPSDFIPDRTEIMMQRNLGAFNNTPGNPGAPGLYYQWGRKDPFLGSSDYKNAAQTFYPASFTTGFSATDKTEFNAETGSIAYTIAHPTHIMTSNTFPHDWLVTANDNLWGNPNISDRNPNPERGHKSIYDPCPHGWRIPPQDIWAGFALNGTANVLSNFNCGLFFCYEGNNEGGTTYYPASGLRIYQSGIFSWLAQLGYYWTSSTYSNPPNGSNQVVGSMLFFDNTYATPMHYNNVRTSAHNVRCAQE